LHAIGPSPEGDVVAVVLRGVRLPSAEDDEVARSAPTDGLTKVVTGVGGGDTSRTAVLVGVELWRSTSDLKGYGSVAASYGPQMLPLDVLRERERQADALLAECGALPACSKPRTYLAMAGMGDGFLVLGTCGGASLAASFTFRTRSRHGAHDRRIGGVLLARARWDEAAIAELDLSERALTAACAAVGSSIADPQFVLAAHDDPRS